MCVRVLCLCAAGTTPLSSNQKFTIVSFLFMFAVYLLCVLRARYDQWMVYGKKQRTNFGKGKMVTDATLGGGTVMVVSPLARTVFGSCNGSSLCWVRSEKLTGLGTFWSRSRNRCNNGLGPDGVGTLHDGIVPLGALVVSVHEHNERVRCLIVSSTMFGSIIATTAGPCQRHFSTTKSPCSRQ